ncbi:MAG: hypothetical protein OEM52_06545 [bacterium]|nr:hypothetical protein [bacterium]
MLKPIQILLVLLLSTSCFAQTTAGSMAGSFLRVGVSGRTKAMGNAGTALASGYSTSFDNPAFLPALKQRNIGLTMHRLALDRKFAHLAYAMPLKGGAGISLSWINAGVDDIDSRDTDGSPLPALDYRDNAFALGFAISPVPDRVSIGLNFKVFYGLFPGIKDDGKSIKGTGVGFDIGGRVELPYNITAAFVLKDLNSKYTWNTEGYWSQGTTKIDKYPVQTRIGLSYRWRELTAAIDGEFLKGIQKLHTGAEYRFFKVDRYDALLRAGIDGKAPTFGLGLAMPFSTVKARLDYAYIVESIAPEDTHVLSWMVNF